MTCFLCKDELPRYRLPNGEVRHRFYGTYLKCDEPERATEAEIKEELRNEIASSGDC